MLQAAKSRFYRLLRSLERYTKTDMVYLAKSGSALVFSDGVLSLIGILISVLFAAYVPKETYGIYKYIVAFAALSVAFSLSGMNTAVTRAVARGFDGTFSRSLILQSRWALLQVVLLIGVSLYYFIKGNAIFGGAFALVAILAPIGSILNTYVAFLSGRKQFGRLALWKIVGGSTQAAVLAAAIIFTPWLITLLLAYYGAIVCINGYYTWRILKDRSLRREVSEEDLAYGKHLSVMNAVGIFAAQAESIIIYQLLGPVALAVYAFSILIPEKLRSLLGFLPAVALPKLAESETGSGRIGAKRKTLVALIGAAAIAVSYALVAPTVFILLFPAYTESILYSQIAALFILAAAPAYLMSILTAEGNRRDLYVISISTPVLKLFLTITGVFIWGLWGALAARIVSGVFQGFLLMRALRPKSD